MLIAQEISPSQSRIVVEAAGRTVLPGLIDTHVHFSGEFGRPAGYRMMLRAGVTTALDLAGDPSEILTTAPKGRGMTVGALFPVIPSRTITGRDPSHAELRQLLQQQLEQGALGLKVLGGHYPLTPDATARAFDVCSEAEAYAAIHVGTTETGSDVDGLAEAVKLAQGRRVHHAHINSYCRGQLREPVSEAAEAIRILENAERAVSESYLSRINAADATCENGAPVSRVVTTCLRLGGYSNTERDLRQAIEHGWAMVHGEVDGEGRLLEPDRGLDLSLARQTAVAVSFPVNLSFSTDGGSLQRNTTLEQGLALVAARALMLREFAWKASGAPARMLGLAGKGRLEPGADADLIVVGSNGTCDVSIIGGRIAFGEGVTDQTGVPTILCHPEGRARVAEATRAIALQFGN